MGLPFWDPVPQVATGLTFAQDPWDIVILGGSYLPGICRVDGLPTLAVDKKKAGGVDGATITVNGYLPGPIDIVCTMWTGPQWDHFQVISPRIWRKPNKGKTKASELAISVSHPALDLWGISSVVVLGVSVPQDGPIVGSKVVKIKCIEFVPVTGQRTQTAKGVRVNVQIAPELDPSRNHKPDPPSKTDMKFSGPPKEKRGGVG